MISSFLSYNTPEDRENQNVFFQHLIHMRSVYRMKITDYMITQCDINLQMRTKIVNWMHEVSDNFHFTTECYFMSLSILDRFLSCTRISKHKFQLCAMSALYLASQYCEVNNIDMHDFIVVSANTYKMKKMKPFVHMMFAKLDFQLNVPNVYTFAMNFYFSLFKIVNPTLHQINQIKSITEISICIMKDYNLLSVDPAKLGACVVYNLTKQKTKLMNKFVTDDVCDKISCYTTKNK